MDNSKVVQIFILGAIVLSLGVIAPINWTNVTTTVTNAIDLLETVIEGVTDIVPSLLIMMIIIGIAVFVTGLFAVILNWLYSAMNMRRLK